MKALSVLILTGLGALAEPVAAIADQEGPYTYTITNGQATITRFDIGYCGALSITNTLGGYPVTTIGDIAFSDCTGLTHVSIPATVTAIKNWAFYRCASLTNIHVDAGNAFYGSEDGVLFNKTFTRLIQFPGGKGGSYAIPDGITNIWTAAFSCNVSLTNVTTPDSLTSIGNDAFRYCDGLTAVTLGTNVTTIGSWAFSWCRSLTNVTIPNSATRIEDWAFEACRSLTSVWIPEGLIRIGVGAFDYCASLTSICVDADNTFYGSEDGVLFNKTFTRLIRFPGGKGGSYATPDSVTAIEDSAFKACHNLSDVTTTDGVEIIGAFAFMDCDSLANVIIGSSVSAIGNSAFGGCNNLIRLVIPGSVITIGHSVFSGCGKLTSLTLGSGVSTIGDWAFDGCTSLVDIIVEKANPSFSSTGGILFNKALTTLIQCPAGKTGSVTIPDSVTNIAYAAFAGCAQVTRCYFTGNTPTFPAEGYPFPNNAAAYYLPGTVGWTNTFAGRPAFLWNPLFTAASLVAGQFSCTVTGTPNIPIAVDACTNLISPRWHRMQSTNLIAGVLNFAEIGATNYPARFYRIGAP